MRIITGKLKGRTIPVPKTGHLRPTSDRTKEGLFSVIEARTYLENTRVLDLFAGSGNLGFEAISRGAASCLFVDSELQHIRQIEKTAEIFKVKDQIQTISMPVETFTKVTVCLILYCRWKPFYKKVTVCLILYLRILPTICL